MKSKTNARYDGTYSRFSLSSDSRMSVLRLAMMVLLVALPASSALSGSLPLQVRSRILDEGSPMAIAIHQNLVLVGTGTQMLILDATDPNALDTLGKIVTGSEIRSIVVRDNYAFLANTSAGMTVVDFQDAREPQIISTVATQTRLFDIHIDGNIAFLADKGSGLDIYDISDLSAPRFLSHYHMFDSDGGGSGLISVFVNRGRAYLGDLENKTILNVENPAAPFLVSRFNGPAWEIEVHDTIAFVTTNSEQYFRTYSVANPDSLVLLDWISATPNDNAPALNFGIAGGRAYIGCEQAGVTVLDVTNPRDLRFVGDFDPQELELDVHNVAATDSVVYFVSYAHGVFSHLPADTGNFQATLAFEAANSPLRIQSDGFRLFVANYYKGLTEVDIQDIRRPIQMWSSRNPGAFGYTEGLATFRRDRSRYVITCDHDSGIRLVDVTDALNPVVMSSRAMTDAKAVTVLGNYAFVCAGETVRVIDISSVHNIPVVATLSPGGTPVNVTSYGDKLYVAMREGGLAIIDVSTPTAPVRVGGYQGFVYDVDVVFPRAYLAMPDTGLLVLDVSAIPPTVLGHAHVTGPASAIEVVDGLAFIAARNEGLRVFNVSNPASMYEVAYRDSIGLAGYLHVSDNSTQFEMQRTACMSMINGGIAFIDVTSLFDSSRTSLIVAGGGNAQSNIQYFIANTNASTNFAYSVLAHSRNYGRRVAYMNPQAWQDLDGDGRNDSIVTSSNMTPENLRQTILNLRDSNDPQKPNIFYFSGHGHYNEIDLNGDANDNVSADSLGTWLDQANLDDSTRLIIVIEACNAGSLIEELNNGRSNRIFIASGEADEVCSFADGESFTTKLWEHVWNGASLGSAFEAARSWLDTVGFDQRPMLDANGDGLPNEFQDRQIANSVFLGGDFVDGATLPVILDSPEIINASGDTATVEIICNGAMENVWYRIYPVQTDIQTEFQTWGSMQPLSSGRYRARFTGLSLLPPWTAYIVEFNAFDDLINMALPKTAILNIQFGPPPHDISPDDFELLSFPNPFNTNVRIIFSMGTSAQASLVVWNVLGQKVATLVNDVLDDGVHVVNWKGSNDQGVALPSGLYFAQLKTSEQVAVSKLLLIR